MDITTTKILLKYGDKINSFLNKKAKGSIIIRNIKDISTDFYQIKKYPAITLELYNKSFKVGTFTLKSQARLNNIINDYMLSKRATSYKIYEHPLIKEHWHIFAILKKDVGNKNISSIYFLTDRNGYLVIEGVSLEKFINDINSSITNMNKKYFTNDNIKELINNLKY